MLPKVGNVARKVVVKPCSIQNPRFRNPFWIRVRPSGHSGGILPIAANLCILCMDLVVPPA